MTTPVQLSGLQALIDRSFARSTAHLTMIMSEQRRLTAERLDDHWELDYGVRLDHYGRDLYVAAIEAEWLVGFAMTPAEDEQMARAAAERAARRNR